MINCVDAFFLRKIKPLLRRNSEPNFVELESRTFFHVCTYSTMWCSMSFCLCISTCMSRTLFLPNRRSWVFSIIRSKFRRIIRPNWLGKFSTWKAPPIYVCDCFSFPLLLLCCVASLLSARVFDDKHKFPTTCLYTTFFSLYSLIMSFTRVTLQRKSVFSIY
jgi:hypothetical protein